jgi:hypothetical protein
MVIRLYVLTLTLSLVIAPTHAAEPMDDDTFLQLMTTRKLPEPQTLDELKAQTKRMRELGADNSQIAEHVSGVVDRRLEATNKPWGESLFNPLKSGAIQDRKNRWQPIDDYMNGRDGKPGKPVDDGKKYSTLAQLAWDNRVGNCAESAAVAYDVLKDTGIPVRIFNSSNGGGHEFAVIGLAPGANPNDPSTWGSDARVVDGWIGRSLNSDEAKDNRFIFGGTTTSSTGKDIVSDQTNGYDNPRAGEFAAELGSRGIVVVNVKNEKGEPVSGAAVKLNAQEAQEATTTSQGIVRFKCYPGNVAIDAVPPKDSHLDKGTGNAQVETLRIVELTISLKTATEPMIRITSPGDGSEASGEKIVVAGELREVASDPVIVQANGTDVTASVKDRTFSAEVPLAEGKNVLQARTGTSTSAAIAVTRVNQPTSPWNGRWKGTHVFTTENSDGGRNTQRLELVLEILQKENQLEVTIMNKSSKKPDEKHTEMFPLQAPLIAIWVDDKTFPPSVNYSGTSHNRIILTIREGKMYLDQDTNSTSRSRGNPTEPWKTYVTTGKGAGAFDRAP